MFFGVALSGRGAAGAIAPTSEEGRSYCPRPTFLHSSAALPAIGASCVFRVADCEIVSPELAIGGLHGRAREVGRLGGPQPHGCEARRKRPRPPPHNQDFRRFCVRRCHVAISRLPAPRAGCLRHAAERHAKHDHSGPTILSLSSRACRTLNVSTDCQRRRKHVWSPLVLRRRVRRPAAPCYLSVGY